MWYCVYKYTSSFLHGVGKEEVERCTMKTQWWLLVAFIVASVVGATTPTKKTEGVVYDPLHAAAYGDGRIIIVGDGGTILLVTNWQRVAAPGLRDLHSVAYGDGMWVAVGDAGKILVSKNNGSCWQQQELTDSRQYRLRGISYNATQGWVARGDMGNTIIYDGVAWREEVRPPPQKITQFGAK